MTTTTIPVIYQDHHLLIVNKPAGLVIHPTYKNVDGTMWNALLADLAQFSADDWRPPVLPDEPGWAGARHIYNPCCGKNALKSSGKKMVWFLVLGCCIAWIKTHRVS